MVSIDKVEQGIANYLDSELMPKIEAGSAKKVFVGVGLSLLIKRSRAVVEKAQEMPVIKMMGIINEDGDVDIDAVHDELKKQIGKNGLSIDIPYVGTMVLKEADVDKIYDCIMEA